MFTETKALYWYSEECAFDYHCSNKGYLWKAKEGQTPECEYATGILPPEMMDVYELYMVDIGMGEPTPEQTAEAIAQITSAVWVSNHANLMTRGTLHDF